MIYGSIEHALQGYRIQAGDGPYMYYIGYSKRAAVQMYRREYGLTYKHICFSEWELTI